MDIGFIGLGHMGFPTARRLIEANNRVVAFDTRSEALERLVALGAQAASSPKEVADLVETVMASLPSPQAARDVATSAGGVIEGARVKRYVDYGFATGLMVKDVRLYLDEAKALGVPVEVALGAQAASSPGRRFGFHVGDQTDRTSCRRHGEAIGTAAAEPAITPLPCRRVGE